MQTAIGPPSSAVSLLGFWERELLSVVSVRKEPAELQGTCCLLGVGDGEQGWGAWMLHLRGDEISHMSVWGGQSQPKVQPQLGKRSWEEGGCGGPGQPRALGSERLFGNTALIVFALFFSA